jgi:hypothetical protein
MLTALGIHFADQQALTAHLLTKKSYAPTHESAAVTMRASAACREARRAGCSMPYAMCCAIL